MSRETEKLLGKNKKWFFTGYSKKDAVKSIAFNESGPTDNAFNIVGKHYNKHKPLINESIWDGGEEGDSCSISHYMMFILNPNKGLLVIGMDEKVNEVEKMISQLDEAERKNILTQIGEKYPSLPAPQENLALPAPSAIYAQGQVQQPQSITQEEMDNWFYEVFYPIRHRIRECLIQLPEIKAYKTYRKDQAEMILLWGTENTFTLEYSRQCYIDLSKVTHYELLIPEDKPTGWIRLFLETGIMWFMIK